MLDLATFILFVNLILLAITVINVTTVRTVQKAPSENLTDLVSILIPLRNESSNVAGVMSSALNQKGLHSFEVIALDDHSTDDTANKLQDYSDSNVRAIAGATLTEGWLGKNFACNQLAKAAHGDFLVFVDADVRLSENAVANAINLMRKLNWDFISPYPRQIAISFLERLTQPLLQWSWFATLPLRLAERLQWKSMVVANGQFFIVRRDAYFTAGGHEAVKAEVLDDMELARTLVSNSYRGGVADGSKVSHCRMYSNNLDLIEGYTKSQWRAFGNPFGAFLVSAALFLTSAYPFILGLGGNVLGWYGYFAIVLTRLLVAAKTQSVISSAILHPISALFWIYLIIRSWVKKQQGALTWRGRKL